jgi:hypothetical protein
VRPYGVTLRSVEPWNLIDYRIYGSPFPGPFGTWPLAIDSIGGGFASNVGLFPYGVESIARTKFLNELSGNRADLGVALGELKQTGQMVGSLAKDLLTGLDRAIKAGAGLKKRVVLEILHFGKMPVRRPKDSARQHARRVSKGRAVASKWLEYQFGLKPLVNDINDAGQALSDAIFVDRVPLKLTIRKGASVIERGHSSMSGAMGFSQLMLGIRGDVQSRCHISATYEIPVGTGRTMNELGLGNPASLVWELTLFSWLVDYVTTMGKWLDSLSARTGVTFLEGTITRVQKVLSIETQIWKNPFAFNYELVEGGGEWFDLGPTYLCGQMRRDVLTDVLPAYRPAVRNRLDLTKLANVLSVLATRSKLS